MSFIIMARGEDGTEFRPTDDEFSDSEDAYAAIDCAKENWPDAVMWVEEFRNRAYYPWYCWWNNIMKQPQQPFEDDTEDLY